MNRLLAPLHRRAFTIPTVVAAAGILAVSGCGASVPPTEKTSAIHQPAPAAVAVVTGDANSPTAQPTASLNALLTRAFNRSAPVAIIDAGGRPTLHAVTLGGRYGNTDAKNAARSQQITAVETALSHVTPTVAQSDPWAATIEAVGWLHDQGGGTLIIDNSGLGTAGFLDYRQPGLLEADPNQLADYAKSHQQLPDATAIHAILVGIGWTAPPQQPLDQPHRARLVAQWAALLSAAGAHVTIDQTPLTGPGPRPAPQVTTIGLTLTSWQPPKGVCATQLDSTELHFKVGTAQLIDPATAKTALRAIVAQLRSNGQNVNLTGTTSSEGGPQINIPLSRSRAETTATLMETIGLPAHQIGTITGLGSHFPGYIPDTTPNGTLLPGPAAANRKVILTWTCTPQP